MNHPLLRRRPGTAWRAVDERVLVHCGRDHADLLGGAALVFVATESGATRAEIIARLVDDLAADAPSVDTIDEAIDTLTATGWLVAT